jgi:membrane-associated protease RseP (regulator of RpoE activity)
MRNSWKTAGIACAAVLSGGVLLGQEQPDGKARGSQPPVNDNAAGADADADQPPAPPSAAPGADAGVRGNATGEKTDADAEFGADAKRNAADADSAGSTRAGARGNANASAANRAALGVRFQAEGRNDLTIGKVVPGSPAAAIGLRPGDRIVSVNGRTYADTDAFVEAAGQFALDQDAEVVYLRDEVVQTATVRFAPWNAVYGDGAARTHTTLRPSFENGAPLPADVQAQGHVNPGYVAPHYGAYPQYQRYYRYRSWDGDDFDDDDCFDD